MGNVPGLRLQQEQKIAIFLSPFIVREETLLWISRIVEMAGDFVLLRGM